jgi:tape measure domain-containing protein
VAQSTVRLIVDAQNAINPLKRVNDATKNLSKNTNTLKDRLNKSNRSIRESGKAAKSASGGFATLNKSLGPLLKALAAIAAVRFVFVNAAEIETQRKSLEVLTGSLSKTNQIIKELQDFGAVTPFTSSELIEQSKRLKAFGFTTDELTDSVKRLSNIAGATGADLSGIATAFGQIRAKGKLQQEENLQLLERGVDITTELKRITGLQGEEFESAMRKGQIGADLVNQAMINLTNEGGAFFGGATAQADTLNGKLSTLIDSTQNLARTIGDQLSPAIKGALDLATKGVIAIENMFKRFGDIGDVGLGNVAKAEMDAQKDAARLTATKFGTNFKGESVFASKEENKFFKEQFKLLRKANIEREKLRNKAFEEVEIIEEGNKKQTKKTEKIIETNKNLKEQLSIFDEIKNINLNILRGEEEREDLLKKNEKFNDLQIKSLKEITTLEAKLSGKKEEQITLEQKINEIKKEFVGEDAKQLISQLKNIEALKEKLGVMDENSRAAEELKNKFDQIGVSIESNIKDNLRDAITGAQSFGQAMTNVLNRIRDKIIDAQLDRLVGGISENFSAGARRTGGRGIGGFLGGLIGGLFANGGRPPVGKASIVGERGPELFVPRSAGTIIPNNAIGGGGTTNNMITVNVDASGTSVQGSGSEADQLGGLIASVVQATIIDEQRAGGLLNR